MPVVTNYEALLSGITWNGPGVSGRPTFITYSFDTIAPSHQAGDFAPAFLDSFRAFTGDEQAIARQALKAWGDACGLTFFEVPAGAGDIRFGSYDFNLGPENTEDAYGFAFTPFVFNDPSGAFEDPLGGDIFIDYGHADFDTVVHEIGHALGLKHPFEGPKTVDPSLDDLAHSVMTYNTAGGPAKGLGTFDVDAVQYLYGLPTSDGAQAASWSWDAQSYVLTQSGGLDADTLAGVAVSDRITGGPGGDYVMSRAGADSLDGGDGDDTMAGGDGEDTLDGGAGADVLDGDEGRDLIMGGAGNDDIWGFEGDDTLAGGAGDDSLNSGLGAGRIQGGEGNDVVFVFGSGVVADGGEGFDEIWFALPTTASASLSYADLSAAGGSFVNFESVYLFGDVNADTLQGGALIDVLVGDSGTDSLSGGSADDALFGGTGADTLAGGDGDDYLEGGTGDDLLIPGEGSDELLGGTGNDTVDFSGESQAITLTVNSPRSLLTGVAETMGGIENVLGTAYGDNITGDAGANRIFGGLGADTIGGGDGSNYLRGDDGGDSLIGGGGFDDINGNVGDDTGSGGLGDDWVVGGKDNDVLFGDDGNDLVYGNLGRDTCDGGAGQDTIRGGQQDDVLTGGAGNDYLSGDKDSDTITGGAGADIFHTFGDAGIDRVTDFSLADGDRVMLDPGTQYSLAQVGADTVISMAGGGQMILVGVTLSTLTGSWIFGN